VTATLDQDGGGTHSRAGAGGWPEGKRRCGTSATDAFRPARTTLLCPLERHPEHCDVRLFSRRKRSENDDLRTQAENLVTAAQIQATAAYTSVGERFDLIYSIPTERWDSILTVAGVFIAATRANHIGLSDARIDSLMEIVARNLSSWRPEGIAAFEDCKAFFDRTSDALEKDPSYQHQPELIGSDALGRWIVWNLVEHAPESEQERALVRALGILVTHSFFN
jgi:hypothetical protein